MIVAFVKSQQKRIELVTRPEHGVGPGEVLTVGLPGAEGVMLQAHLFFFNLYINFHTLFQLAFLLTVGSCGLGVWWCEW